jgi:Zn-dependent protease
VPLREAVIFFGCLVVAIILHEISHGVVAMFFGDDTAKRAGRLTLNPIPHIDPVGSILIPAIGALSGLPVIGWAKPVPVDPSRMRHPRRDMVFVSLAGPTTNFLLMATATGAPSSAVRSTRARRACCSRSRSRSRS